MLLLELCFKTRSQSIIDKTHSSSLGPANNLLFYLPVRPQKMPQARAAPSGMEGNMWWLSIKRRGNWTFLCVLTRQGHGKVRYYFIQQRICSTRRAHGRFAFTLWAGARWKSAPWVSYLIREGAGISLGTLPGQVKLLSNRGARTSAI